jgi:hypothetical protein
MKRIAMISLILGLVLTAGPVFSSPSPATKFDAVLGHYEAVRQSLLADSMAGIPAHAAAIAKLGKDAPADLVSLITAAASKLKATKDLNAARDAFADLSKPLVRWRKAVGGKGTIVAFCSMTKKSWLQPKGEIGNPYYGKSMPRCGEVVSK